MRLLEFSATLTPMFMAGMPAKHCWQPDKEAAKIKMGSDLNNIYLTLTEAGEYLVKINLSL